jgi:glutamate 5-kinase
MATSKTSLGGVLARAKREASQMVGQGDLTTKLKAMQPVSRAEYNALLARLSTLEARVQQLVRAQRP